jgi:hypothetical protein
MVRYVNDEIELNKIQEVICKKLENINNNLINLLKCNNSTILNDSIVYSFATQNLIQSLEENSKKNPFNSIKLIVDYLNSTKNVEKNLRLSPIFSIVNEDWFYDVLDNQQSLIVNELLPAILQHNLLNDFKEIGFNFKSRIIDSRSAIVEGYYDQIGVPKIELIFKNQKHYLIAVTEDDTYKLISERYQELNTDGGANIIKSYINIYTSFILNPDEFCRSVGQNEDDFGFKR